MTQNKAYQAWKESAAKVEANKGGAFASLSEYRQAIRQYDLEKLNREMQEEEEDQARAIQAAKQKERLYEAMQEAHHIDNILTLGIQGVGIIAILLALLLLWTKI